MTATHTSAAAQVAAWPNGRQPSFVITTLAIYQTRFWALVGAELVKRGVSVAFVCFDDPSAEFLRERGLRTYSASAAERASAPTPEEFSALLQKFGIDSPERWFLHERHVYAIRDEKELRRKLVMSLALAERAIAAESRDHAPVLIQEVGGFLSVVGSFFAARAAGVENWFIEPSFFRGTLFFYRNTFTAPRVRGELPAGPSPAVSEYLERTLRQRTIVIPKKDAHQYRGAAGKVFNLKNARRLVGKLVDKYLLGKQMEFGYIGHHTTTHLRMLFNSWKLRGSYTGLDAIKPFVYYPLHVPGDMALTLRSPDYLDQLELVSDIARALPPTHRIAIKEHPAMIGAVHAGRLKALMKSHANLVLISPGTNNFEVLSVADAVVSVNSKSGAEAALLGKPVLVLGDAFYSDSPLVTPVTRRADLPAALAKVLGAEAPKADDALTARYFESVWRASRPGELYIDDSENISQFAESLLSSVSAARN
jgi:hypothetical protein